MNFVKGQDDLEALVDEFRSSGLLQHISRELRKIREDAAHEAETEVEKLRTENAQLRAQFALSSMELPGQSGSFVKTVSAAASNVPDSPTVSARHGSLATNAKSNRRSNRASKESRGSILRTIVEASASGKNNSGDQIQQSAEPRQDRSSRFFSGKRVTRMIADAHGAISGMSMTSYSTNRTLEDSKKDTNVFPDSEAMKEQVRKAIQRPQTNVQSYFHDTGFAQHVARQNWFEYLALSVIALNALWVAVDADLNDAAVLSEAPLGFQIIENFFCCFFAFEWGIRLCALEQKIMGIKNDAWFLFDGVLLVPMVLDTWILPLFFKVIDTEVDDSMSNTSVLKLVRISKIVRMARMVRLLRSCPELLVLIKGIGIASKSVFCTLCLLMLVVYVFAVAFKQTTEGTAVGDRYFRTVPEAMQTLLLDGVIPDLSYFMNDVGRGHLAYAMLLVAFIVLASVTVMNMLIGILVQVVTVVSAVENEQMKVNYVRMRLMKMLNLSDQDFKSEDIYISRREFEMILVQPDGARAMQDMGVDPVGLVDFGDYIFAQSKKREGRAKDGLQDHISFGRFIELAMQFRGSNISTVRDIVDMRKMLSSEMQRISSSLARLSSQLRNVERGSMMVSPASSLNVPATHSPHQAPANTIYKLSQISEEGGPLVEMEEIGSGEPPHNQPGHANASSAWGLRPASVKRNFESLYEGLEVEPVGGTVCQVLPYGSSASFAMSSSSSINSAISMNSATVTAHGSINVEEECLVEPLQSETELPPKPLSQSVSVVPVWDSSDALQVDSL